MVNVSWNLYLSCNHYLRPCIFHTHHCKFCPSRYLQLLMAASVEHSVCNMCSIWIFYQLTLTTMSSCSTHCRSPANTLVIKLFQINVFFCTSSNCGAGISPSCQLTTEMTIHTTHFNAGSPFSSWSQLLQTNSYCCLLCLCRCCCGYHWPQCI